MSIWALADLHLALSKPDKKMDDFGFAWKNYMQRIEEEWRKVIKDNDLIIIAGDITWALTLEEAKQDLEWIHKLPGSKVFIKGNHDYWCSSASKVRSILPPSMHYIYRDVFIWNDVAIAGARLWDTPEISYSDYIVFQENPKENLKEKAVVDATKVYEKELRNLEWSLSQLPEDKYRIVMTHYPPVNAAMDKSCASNLLEEYHVDVCVFGHLHSVRENSLEFGQARGVKYLFTACDYLKFKPLLVREECV